jgi:hypothetical protein
MKLEKDIFLKNLIILPRAFTPAISVEAQKRITHHVSRITYHVSIGYSQFTNCQQSLVIILLCICICSFLSCGTKAPEDYYLRLLAMEKAGEQERMETGRKIGEIVMSEESLQPMVIALQPEQRALSSNSEPLNSDLLKIIYIKTNTPETEVTTESSVPPLVTETSEPKPTPAVVPIGINKEVLKQSLIDKNIDVIGIVTRDGRLDGEKNLIQVHFALEAISNDALYEKFLYICAIIYGYDMDQNRKAKPSVNEVNTVDTVMGFAIVEDFPYMVLEGKMENYIDFVNKKITYREWISNLIIKKLKQ